MCPYITVTALKTECWHIWVTSLQEAFRTTFCITLSTSHPEMVIHNGFAKNDHKSDSFVILEDANLGTYKRRIHRCHDLHSYPKRELMTEALESIIGA